MVAHTPIVRIGTIEMLLPISKDTLTRAIYFIAIYVIKAQIVIVDVIN